MHRWHLSILVVVAVGSAAAGGCGTDAVGVDDCRAIETARCEAAAHCGSWVEDTDACIRFYRDQCLHGLALGEAPGAPLIDNCVETLEAVGQCAEAGQDADTCPDLVLRSGTAAGTTPCDAILEPENLQACAFLESVTIPEPDAGQGGTDSGS